MFPTRKLFSFFCMLSLFISTNTRAAVFDDGIIKGHVTDAKTGEPLTGAVISIVTRKYKTVSGLDGSFVIKGLPAGQYELSVTMVSFQTLVKTVTVTAGPGQTDISFAMQSTNKSLENVFVTGTLKNGVSDASARQIEKGSDNVLNVLSARTIQLAPDVTVANILRRVSGVTVDRGDDGEGRYPVIRGMDKRYNYTLVNGIKIPSPDDKNRYIPMDIFPSEMLQRLEVIKALTPDLEGDAIGGVMNLIMKDAPEHKIFQAQAALGYSQMLFDNSFYKYDHSVNSKSPAELHNSTPTYTDFTKSNLQFTNKKSLPNGQLGFTVGNRFFDKKFGIIFSTSLQSTDRIGKETFFGLSAQPDPKPNASVAEYNDAELRTYYTHENRLGLHTKMDYQFNKNNSISLYSIYMQLNSYRTRFYTDSTSIGRTAPGLGNVKYNYYSRNNLQSVYNITLQGKHGIVPGKLLFDWSAVYSDAGQKTPDRTELSTIQAFGSGSASPQVFVDGPYGLTKIWQHNSDKDLAGYANLHYKFNAGSNNFDIGTGIMARHKDRDNYYNQYKFKSGTTFYTDINSLSTLTPDGGTPQSPNLYTSKEDISALYGEIRWTQGRRWNILGGLRIEHTQQKYNQEQVPDNIDARTGESNYYDFLPSVHIKYGLTDKAALHVSFFKSIARPGFFEVVPYQFPGDYYTETGNYNLHHTKAYNFDARYELFPGVADQLLIGVFYKSILDPIEYVYDRPATSNSVIKPENIGSAVNLGAELVLTKYFNKFGVSANYTYTHSKVTVAEKFYYQDAGGNATTTFVSTSRPLQGQAANIGNIALLYKDAKTGTDLQLAAVYTGEHIVYASPYYGKDNAAAEGSGLDYWQRGNVVMDLSGEQKITKHFTIYCKITNLLNTADITELHHSSTVLTNFPPFQDRSDRILVGKKKYGQAYLIGFRYHL